MLIVLGSVSVITKATRVSDHTFSVTGHIHTNKLEKVIKSDFKWSSFRTSFWCWFVFVRKASIRATNEDIIDISHISPNTLSCKIHLFRYDYGILYSHNLNYFIKQLVMILSQEPLL